MINVRLMFAVELVWDGRACTDSVDCTLDVAWSALLPVGSEVGLLPQECTVEGYNQLLRLRLAGYGWQLATPLVVLCRLDPTKVILETREACLEYLKAIGCKVTDE